MDTSKFALVVDDHRKTANALAALIRISGYRAVVAYDAFSGRESAQAATPSIAFIDIAMPAMAGFVLAQQLREIPRQKRMLMVAISAYATDEDKQQAGEAGFDLHIRKSELLGYVRNILQNPDAFVYRLSEHIEEP